MVQCLIRSKFSMNDSGLTPKLPLIHVHYSMIPIIRQSFPMTKAHLSGFVHILSRRGLPGFSAISWCIGPVSVSWSNVPSLVLLPGMALLYYCFLELLFNFFVSYEIRNNVLRKQHFLFESVLFSVCATSIIKLKKNLLSAYYVTGTIKSTRDTLKDKRGKNSLIF